MNTFSTIDPAKNLAGVSIRILQGFCILFFCLSLYLCYLSYLGLFPDWQLVHELSDGEIEWNSESTSWQVIILAIPGIISLLGFFVLGYLGKVIKSE